MVRVSSPCDGSSATLRPPPRAVETCRNGLQRPRPCTSTERISHHVTFKDVTKISDTSSLSSSAATSRSSDEKCKMKMSGITTSVTPHALPPFPPSDTVTKKAFPALRKEAYSSKDIMIGSTVTPQCSVGMRSYSAPVCTEFDNRHLSRLSFTPFMMMFKRTPSVKQPSYVPWSQRTQKPTSEVDASPNLRHSPPYELSSSGPPPLLTWPSYDEVAVHTPPTTPTSKTWSLFRSGSLRLLPSHRSLEESDRQSTRTRRLSFFRSTALPSTPRKKLEISHPLTVDSDEPRSPTTPSAPSRPPRPLSLFPIFDTPRPCTRQGVHEELKADVPLAQVGQHFDALPGDVAHASDSPRSLSSYTSSSSSELAQQYTVVEPADALNAHVEHQARVARHRRKAFHALDGESKTRTKRMSESEKDAARKAGLVVTSYVDDYRADASPSQREKDLIMYTERMRGDSRGYAKSSSAPSPRLTVVQEEEGEDENETRTSSHARDNEASSSFQPQQGLRQARDVAPRTVDAYQSWWESRPQFDHQPLDFSPVDYTEDEATVQLVEDRMPAPSPSHQRGLARIHMATSRDQPCQSRTIGPRSSQEDIDHDKALAFKRSLDEETERRKKRYDEQEQGQERSNRYTKQLRRLENGRSQLTSGNSTPTQPQSPAKPSWSSNSTASDSSPASASPTTRQPSQPLRLSKKSPEEKEAYMAEQRAVTRGRLFVKDAVSKQRYRFSRLGKEQESFQQRSSTLLADEPSPNATMARQVLRQKGSSSRTSSRPMPQRVDDDSAPAPTTGQRILTPPPLRLASKKQQTLPPLPSPPTSVRRAQVEADTMRRRIEIQQQCVASPEPRTSLLPPRTTSLPDPKQRRRRRQSKDSTSFWSDDDGSASVYSQGSGDGGSMASPLLSAVTDEQYEGDVEGDIIDLYSSSSGRKPVYAEPGAITAGEDSVGVTSMTRQVDESVQRRLRGRMDEGCDGGSLRREKEVRRRQEEMWKLEAEKRVETIRRNLRFSVASASGL